MSKESVPRWQRIELERGIFLLTIPNVINSLDPKVRSSRLKNNNDEYIKTGFLYTSLDVLCFHHLEFEFDFMSASDGAKLGSEDGIDYFFGEWRDRYFDRYEPSVIKNSDWCRKNLDWFDQWRMSLLVSLVARREENVSSLAKWIGLDLECDGGAWERSQSHWRSSSCLASFLLDPSSDLKEGIQWMGTTEDPFALGTLDFLNALKRGDRSSMSKTLDQLARQHVEEELLLDVPTSAIAMDASLLNNLAERHGHDLTESLEMRDFIISGNALLQRDDQE